MKKIKKYGGIIFVSIFSLFVGLGALLTNISIKEETINITDSSTINLSSGKEVKEQTSSARSVSDTDIDSYIAGKTAPGQLFYPYDIVVSKVVSWTEEHYYVGYSEDEQGELYFDPENSNYSIPPTYTFKKGYAYLVNAAFVDRRATAWEIQNNKATWDYEAENRFYELYDYNFYNSNDANFTYKNNLGCDADVYYANESWYTWDNEEVCSVIASKWTSKINSIFDDPFTRHFAGGGSMHLLVPSKDVTVSRNQKELTWGLEAYIHKGKLLEGDYTAPIFGGTVNLSVNVDNQPSLEEILSHVKAIDETDGEVPITVTSSTYIPGEMKVGEYFIHLSATDSAGNTGTETITLNRFDSTSPSIDGQDSYILNYDHDITLQKVLNNLTTSDNVDTNLPLEVVSDTFSGNEHTLGNYQVVVRTKDLSNNYSANKTVNLAVKNQGNSVITAPKEITVTISSPLSLEALKERISVTDGYDGEITNYTIEGFDEYTRTERSVGINPITISYTNSGNNTATATTQIKKVDDKAPGIYFDLGYFVMLSPGETFTMNQFKVQAAKVLKINVEDILDIQGEYDTSTEGSYVMTLSLVNESVQEFTILVGDANKAPAFTFKDIFTKVYWVVTWEYCVANFLHFNAWNWLNWTLVVSAGVVTIAIIAGGIYYKKHHKKK
ncbi:MAG: hypothetical protein K2P14_03845 [Anaeroplasmataceae bacterium]|nr:hypothetical protein [Anaeroplasmataceae bacterium]